LEKVGGDGRGEIRALAVVQMEVPSFDSKIRLIESVIIVG
jgi:hypothetical protein